MPQTPKTKKRAVPAPSEAAIKISRLNLGAEGNHIFSLLAVGVVIFLIIWGYFVFDFLYKTYTTMRDVTPVQRQAQSIMIDVKQAQQTVNEIEQGKLY